MRRILTVYHTGDAYDFNWDKTLKREEIIELLEGAISYLRDFQ